MRYTKKPVTIEAVQLRTVDDDGTIHLFDDEAMPEWLFDASTIRPHQPGAVWATETGVPTRSDPLGQRVRLAIGTLEGVMIAEPGDFIICGIKGEIYPCKAEIFEESYDFAVRVD